MSRIVYVNGAYQRYGHAMVHAEDRGFQFADGVYEVCMVADGIIIDEPRHLARLTRSLNELGINQPLSEGAWRLVISETVRRNRVRTGMVYLQVTRGEGGPRDFYFPAADVRPTVVVLARSSVKAGLVDPEGDPGGIAVTTMADIRWGRRDIKTTMLLPAAMAKEAAKAQGSAEAWLVDADGYITEGASSNAWIISKDNHIITRHANREILRGITRMTLLDFIESEGLVLEERPFTVAEAKEAREAFLTAATNPVTPVIKIDDRVLGNGKPGSLTLRLHQNLLTFADKRSL